VGDANPYPHLLPHGKCCEQISQQSNGAGNEVRRGAGAHELCHTSTVRSVHGVHKRKIERERLEPNQATIMYGTEKRNEECKLAVSGKSRVLDVP